MKKRILIYGINYAPEIAGVGRYTGEIGAHLAAAGHEVCVVTAPPHYPGWQVREGYRNALSRETRHGVEIFRCPLFLDPAMRGIQRLLAPLSFAMSSAAIAVREILKRRPEVVIAVEPTLFVAPVALAAARLVGAKTVLHVQDLEVEAAFAVGHLRSGILSRLAAAFDRAMARGFDRVITISNRMAEKIFDKGVDPARIEVVRNWVDVEAVRPMPTALAYRSELGLKPSDFVVLYSGNLGAKQGVGILIETARQLAQNDPNVVFAIAGQGPMRADVERAAAELPNVRVLDFQPEARFGEFLSVADVHVLPQERNAADLLLPSKLGGMLASGRPIIVTADPGTELAHFLGDSCVLTEPGCAPSLAAAVRQARREGPSPAKAQARLALAASLSKSRLIEIFTRAVLFLEPDASVLEPARAAA